MFEGPHSSFDLFLDERQPSDNHEILLSRMSIYFHILIPKQILYNLE